MKKCPHCAEEIQDEAKVCRFCQRDVIVVREEFPGDLICPSCGHHQRPGPSHCDQCQKPMRGAASVAGPRAPAGKWLIALGFVGAFYFFAMFDTSVALPDGSGRVNNIGLLNTQQNGVLFSLALVVVGAIMLAARRKTA